MESEIYVCGDLHGRFIKEEYNSLPYFNKEDYIIVCGDFGYLLQDKQKKEELKNLDDLQSSVNGATVLFVDGNHENFNRLNNLKSEYMFDNEVGKVRDGIYHLKRARPYHINGKSIFTFGGATSTDRMNRIPGLNWWHQEVPNELEIDLGYNVLDSERFDYIITHTCPVSVRRHISNKKLYNIYCYTETVLEKFRDYINDDFDKWYFGHFHTDEEIDNKFRILYKEIVKIGE